MGYRTPNIDRIAAEVVRFADYYGEQSCTAGRAAFICSQNQMDLSEHNAARLREVLAPFIAAARRSGGSTPTHTRRSSTAARPSRAREETAAIRAWAGANDFSVSARGRIAASVREAYENRAAAANPALVVQAPTVEAEARPKRRSRKKIADPFTAE